MHCCHPLVSDGNGFAIISVEHKTYAFVPGFLRIILNRDISNVQLNNSLFYDLSHVANINIKFYGFEF